MSTCPSGQHPATKRDGYDVFGRQRYHCRPCHRDFTAHSISALSGYRWPPDVIVMAVRWYCSLPLSATQVVRLFAERHIDVSARTVLNWVQTFGPRLAAALRRHRRRVGRHWTADEVFRFRGQQKLYLSRAVDEHGQVEARRERSTPAAHQSRSHCMHVLVTGATGFIGSHFVPFLAQRGHTVQRVTRRPSRPGDVAWNPARGEIDAAALQSPEAVVHLAGENIADDRWTEAKKQRIRDSRIKGTRLLSDTLAELPHPPRVLVSASAVGYYGHRGEEVLTEESGSGKGFLAAVCRQWEAATQPAVHAGIRTVCLRNGLVLRADGGVLHTLLPSFKLGLGGPVGSGRQYGSWIALPDLLHVILHCIETETLAGPVNAVAPTPVTMQEFATTLGQVLNRPTRVTVPEFAAHLALGEMANELVLASARVVPARLSTNGYGFIHATLAVALRDLLRKPS